MIRLQPISTSDLQHYKFMEELLIDSFPPEEYRQLERATFIITSSLMMTCQSASLPIGILTVSTM